MGRILVVDEEVSIVRAMEKLLTSHGHEVRTASGGRTTLEELDAHPPELIVMEEQLHGATGIEILREVRRRGWRGPVVLTTTLLDAGFLDEAEKLGAIVELKPFEPTEMLRRIDRALEAGRLGAKDPCA